MKQEPLCKSCAERDIAYVLHGSRYMPELICLYDMANFPYMMKCNKYQPKEIEDEGRAA